MADEEGWKTDTTNSAVTVRHKLAPGTSTVTIKIEGTMDVPILNVFSLLYESDLYYTWQRLISQSNTISNYGPTKRVIQNILKIPIPFMKKRDNLLYCTAVNAMKT